jgi:hypothetical protein
MRLPDESRPRLFRRESFALDRLNEAVVAAVFVFITIGMVYSSLIMVLTGILAGRSMGLCRSMC